jgi:hypothetical protein
VTEKEKIKNIYFKELEIWREKETYKLKSKKDFDIS